MATRANSAYIRTLLAVVAVLTAIVVWSFTPTRPDSYEALSMVGRIGTRLVGRNLAVTVHRILASHRLLAMRVGSRSTVYNSRGYWVIVDVTAETIMEPSGIHAQLYSADLQTSERNIGVFGIPGVLDIGLRYRQVMAFEIPELAPNMRISLMNTFLDNRTGLMMDSPLDSRIDVLFSSNQVELMRQLSVGQDGDLE